MSSIKIKIDEEKVKVLCKFLRGIYTKPDTIETYESEWEGLIYLNVSDGSTAYLRVAIDESGANILYDRYVLSKNYKHFLYQLIEDVIIYK